MWHIIVVLLSFVVAFFPAKLWFSSQPWRVGWIFTVIFALISYIPWIKNNWKSWFVSLVAVMVFWVIIESIWVVTCYPYWCFEYSNLLGPKIWGIVPYLLIFTWPPLVIARYSIGRKICDYRLNYMSIALIGLVFTDLLLDPLAITIWLWNYPEWGFRFGVPLSNFAGWCLSWSVSLLLIDMLIWKAYNKSILYIDTMLITLSFFLGCVVRNFIL